MFLPRKGLSDITNLSISKNGNEPVPDDQKFGKNGCPMLVNEYMDKLLKENNALMRTHAEKNAEVQNLRLVVAKVNQQNWQLAQAHFQMLTELNLGKDKVKATQHELGCTSAALKVKAQELEDLKKLSRKNKELQRVENNTLADTSSQAAPTSHKEIRLPDRKQPKRSLSLGPMSITRQAATVKMEEKCSRKPRRSVNLKVGSWVPSGDLFELDDAKFPLERIRDLKDEASSPSSASLGRPLRRAAVKVNSYREMPLNVKLRRPEQ